MPNENPKDEPVSTSDGADVPDVTEEEEVADDERP